MDGHAPLAAPGAALAGVQVVEDEAGDGLGLEADRGIAGDALMPSQFLGDEVLGIETAAHLCASDVAVG